MSFEPTFRRIAVDPASVASLFPTLAAQFGELVSDGGRPIPTIGAFFDDEAQTRLRAASLEHDTITRTPLSDGRVAFKCMWQSDLAAAFDAGHINGAEELTEEQFLALQIPDEESQP